MAQGRRSLIAGTVRGVVFDLDGTLVDGYEAISAGVNAARAHYGLPPLATGDVRGRVGLGLTHLMADVVGVERANEAAAIFRGVYETTFLPQTWAVPRLEETLSGLRGRGIRMTVASNKPARYSVRILEHLGVLAYFDLVAGPETAGAVKPDPRMIRACLAAMEVEPGEAIYVGDMTLDVESGDRAGVGVVLVAGGSSSREDLDATGRPVLERLDDLPGRL